MTEKETTSNLIIPRYKLTAHLHIDNHASVEISMTQPAEGLTEDEVIDTVDNAREHLFSGNVVNVQLKTADGNFIALPKEVLNRSWMYFDKEEVG